VETHPLRVLEDSGLVMLQIPCMAVPTLGEAEAAGNTPEVDVGQQLLGNLAAGNSLSSVPHSNVPLPNVPLPNVPHPNVPLPNITLPEVPLPAARLPEACPDGSVGDE